MIPILWQVPVEHKVDFVRDINTSVAELLGRTMRSEIKLISSVEVIEAALSLHSPVIELGALQVDFFDPSQQLLDSLDTTDLKKDSSPRFIHVDLGIRRDRAAIACTKIVGAVNQQRRDPTSNLTVVDARPGLRDGVCSVLGTEARPRYPNYEDQEFHH